MNIESNFEEKLKNFNIKYLYTLKMSERPSPNALKIGCSLVALYFEKLEKPIDSQEIYEINQGLNHELFSYYFKEPQKMYQEIIKSKEILEKFQIPIANIRFAQLLIKEVDTEAFNGKNTVIMALEKIYNFIHVFIELYFQRAKDNPEIGKLFY